MTAVGYFELGEMARWATLVTNVKLILANLDQCVNDGGQKCKIARQDGGIVCALCDGGVKLMVEVKFDLKILQISRLESPPDLATGPPHISLPHVPQPSQPVPGEDDRTAST